MPLLAGNVNGTGPAQTVHMLASQRALGSFDPFARAMLIMLPCARISDPHQAEVAGAQGWLCHAMQFGVMRAHAEGACSSPNHRPSHHACP